MSKTITAERLKELGLTKIGNKLDKKQDMKRRAAIAYEFYRVASPETIRAFGIRMEERTIKITKACPECKGKGKEVQFFSEDKEALAKMKKAAKKSKRKASDCGYCQRTGAERRTFDKIRFTAIEEYEQIPPEPCLAQLEIAHKRKCFDTFEVADVQTIEQRPDPIIFGRINGCEDRFFVTQWDEDLDINDILEGK